MTSIRIAIATALAIAAVMAGGATAHNAAPTHTVAAASFTRSGPIPCCEE